MRAVAEGVLLAVRATAGARREEISGLWHDTDDQVWLEVKVHATPEDGKANDAIISMLSIQFSVKRRHVMLVKGHRSRLKTFRINGATAEGLATLLENMGHRNEG
ncbi:MAG: DUF167 domain-containing protein [Alphaproteobacteria bacterium]|nr:DUF167 domain-containing protein [Alphaproteobacteria bacterium]